MACRRNDSLNAVSPDNPVSLGHASGHAAYFNEAALEAAGITDDTPGPGRRHDRAQHRWPGDGSDAGNGAEIVE